MTAPASPKGRLLSGIVAAVDPGRSKCGLVLADCSRGEILTAHVVAADQTLMQLEAWQQQTPLQALVMGDGTSSRQWMRQLQHLAPVQLVNEAGTTLRARDRYWQIWPARGWRRLLPQGLRVPPCELDAIAALVLLEDHLGRSLHWSTPPPSGPGLKTLPAP